MVNVLLGPEHDTPPFVNVGVTVIVAVTGDVPVLIATNDAMSPLPLAARPIDVVLFVQAYVVVPPVLFVVNTTAVVFDPLHNVWLVG